MKGNSVSIKGNLTRNAEIRGISGDRSCVTFGLAWNNNHLRADNTPIDQPHYFEVSCWMSAGQQNYFLPLLTKGTTCSIIDGYLSYGTWVTKDGEKRSRVEIAVTDPFSSMTLLAPRKHRYERRVIEADLGNLAGVDNPIDSDNNIDAKVDSTNHMQVPPSTDDGDEHTADSQTFATSEVPISEALAAEIAHDAKPPLDFDELSPEDIFGSVADKTPISDTQESDFEPVSDSKTNKSGKPKSPTSQKRATA